MTKIEDIEEVAKRLKGLREALDMSVEEVANVCGIDCDVYRAYESGEADVPVSFVRTLAQKFGVELPAILFGEEPKMSSYFVTRCGNGVSVERSKAYSYQALAAGFDVLCEVIVGSVRDSPKLAPSEREKVLKVCGSL